MLFEIVMKLSLAELWRPAGFLQTIFLSFLHTGITGKISRFLKDRSEIFVCLIQCPGQTMTDRTCLTGKSTAADIYLYIIFIRCICRLQRLTNDDLKGLKTKVIVHIFFIDRDFTSAWCNVYAGNAGFSSSCSIKC